MSDLYTHTHTHTQLSGCRLDYLNLTAKSVSWISASDICPFASPSFCGKLLKHLREVGCTHTKRTEAVRACRQHASRVATCVRPSLPLLHTQINTCVFRTMGVFTQRKKKFTYSQICKKDQIVENLGVWDLSLLETNKLHIVYC